MKRAGIALGSNLGDSERLLKEAADALKQIAMVGEPVLCASFFRTAPVDCPPGSPDFLNTVVEIAWNASAHDLLAATREIERLAGRTPQVVRNAPRPVDLDLLYLGDEMVDDDWLTLPHPRIAQRFFVLAPLAEIRPELVLPGQRENIAQLLARVK